MASVPTPGNFPFKAKKCLCPGVIPGSMGAPDKDKVSFLRNFKMERLQFLDILAKKEKIEDKLCSVFEGF